MPDTPYPRSVYVAFEAFPRPKGAASHIASMVSALADTHGPVWLLCLGVADMPAYQIEGDALIRRFKAYHPNMLRRAAEFGEFVRNTLAELADGVDLAVFRDPWGGSAALSTGVASASIFEVNALPTRELPYTYPQAAGNRPLMEKIGDVERFCLSTATRILTVSPVNRDSLVTLGVEPARIDVVHNCAGQEFFDATGEEPPLEELTGGRWFGYFGSLHRWQGVELAVDAFSLIASEVRDVRMLIVGGGRKEVRKLLRRRIRKRGIEDRVLFSHAMPPAQLAQAVARLEFSLAPLLDTARNTHQGCCPVKIVESMAAGVPVVASDLRVSRFLVRDGVDGMLVEPGDARAWGRAMLAMLADCGLRKRLGAAARHAAAVRFAPAHVHARLAECFDRAIAEAVPETERREEQ